MGAWPYFKVAVTQCEYNVPSRNKVWLEKCHALPSKSCEENKSRNGKLGNQFLNEIFTSTINARRLHRVSLYKLRYVCFYLLTNINYYKHLYLDKELIATLGTVCANRFSWLIKRNHAVYSSRSYLDWIPSTQRHTTRQLTYLQTRF